MNRDAPLLEMVAVRREYRSAAGVFTALADINLSIYPGELIAIVGASGSGKSTLMNVLGCLDRPTSGTYRVGGQDVRSMDADTLSDLRCHHFGFIFQRYNLLPGLTALENVELPAVYAGQARASRRQRAQDLLARLKLQARLGHRPNELSGGQQQRVSIARALINGGHIILADEPTGALDSHSGEEVLAILKDLKSQGHTVIIVTHDPKVAQHAERVLTLADGRIVSDASHSGNLSAGVVAGNPRDPPRAPRDRMATLTKLRDRYAEALRMALLAMKANRLRTFLTMLGIIIGIASVASVVALGRGGQERILSIVRAIGTNTIEIYPGKGFGDMKAAGIETLTPSDAEQIAHQPYVDSVTPKVSASTSFRFGNVSLNGEISGVGDSYFRVHGLALISGRVLSSSDTGRLAQVVVMSEDASRRLFPGNDEPVGKVILVGAVPFEVIGVTKHNEYASESASGLDIWAPYTSVTGRIVGKPALKGITVRVSDDASPETVGHVITRLLVRRHGRHDFFTLNTDAMLRTAQATTATLALLISSVAVVSLVVGGIGVMNIMLVSVTERTREIGIRAAIGARRKDILWQFMIEALLVCLIGGAIGVLAALTIRWIFSQFVTEFRMLFSVSSIVAAIASSVLIGLVFGYIPARNAARLDPVEALSRE